MILDLVNSVTSNVQYDIDKYPDGQQSIQIKTYRANVNRTTYERELREDLIIIKSRMSNFMDVELIIAATQALRGAGTKKIGLFVPYFLGARSDRRFSYGGVHYLKDVIAPIINSQNYEVVYVLDPHSDVLEGCINNLEKINNFELVKMALNDNEGFSDNVVLVSPDAGAYKKIFDVAQEFGIEDIVTATKVRDLKTGKIIETRVDGIDKYNDDVDFIIVDDICDGGRTFIEIAKILKEKFMLSKIKLVVSHGIFSQGFKVFDGLVDKIYTTDSYKQHKSTNFVKVLNLKQIHK